LIDLTLVALFLPTFFIVSITPGMCMTLAMTLGMSYGVRTTMWMMWGELLGVAIVAIAAVIGVSALMLQHPEVFFLLKWLGGAYLFYLGINMWRSRGKLAVSAESSEHPEVSRVSLFNQGLLTAIANPKGWAFMISLLPPFITPEQALLPQLTLLVLIIMSTEFTCMMLYASGGKSLAKMLSNSANVQFLNKISGTLMMAVAFWLALGT
jgi:threonine/homoserine/homoserine lactone efflux protein